MSEFLCRVLPYLGSNLLTAALCVWLFRRARRIRTNGDWLRSLSDEELCCMIGCPQATEPGWCCEEYTDCCLCTEEWLKEERTCSRR